MAEGMIRADGIVDIVDINTQLAKFGKTTDTPGHIEVEIVSIRARLEGCTLDGNSRPWVDLRTTVTGFKMMMEAFALAIKSKNDSIEVPTNNISIREIKARRRFLRGLPENPTEDQEHKAP